MKSGGFVEWLRLASSEADGPLWAGHVDLDVTFAWGGKPTVLLQQSTCGIWGQQTFWTPLLRSDAMQCAILESQ